jgi:hypothetical protein
LLKIILLKKKERMANLNTLNENPVTDYVKKMHSKIEQDMFNKNLREEKMFALLNVMNEEFIKIQVLNNSLLLQLQKQHDLLEKMYFKIMTSS